MALPDTARVAVSQLAGELEEGLLAFGVGAGLQVRSVILDAEAPAFAGPKVRHEREATAERHGSDGGLVTRWASAAAPRHPAAGEERRPVGWGRAPQLRAGHLDRGGGLDRHEEDAGQGVHPQVRGGA